MKIKIYSPVDATIKPISECADEIFAAKTLGDGIVIIPKKDNFKSPFESAKVEMIFDTKHAIYFDVNGVKALMHIGLDTVKLNGSPFKVKTKKGNNVDIESDIISVDMEAIKKAGLSNETPIVFETDDTKKVGVKILKTNAKQGEVIAEVTFTETKKTEKTDLYEIKSFENKYKQIAKEIYEYVGPGNYKDVYNCMTRFRVSIFDKSKVNLDKIKKIAIVKDTQYLGNELQIIIGSEVSKVVDEFKNYEKNIVNEKQDENKAKNEQIIIQKNSMPLSKRFLGAMMGIMGPTISLFIACGLFSGIYALLTQTGVISTTIVIEGTTSVVSIGIGTLYYFDMFSSLMFILGNCIMSSLGVLLIYNIVRHFNGNTIYAIGIGLIMVSRAFYPTIPNTIDGLPDANYIWNMNGMLENGSLEPGSFPIDNYLNFGFGDWISDPLGSGKSGWLFFRIGDYPIVLGGMEGSIFHFAFAGFLIIVLDKWVKSWIPSILDTFFRPFLVVSITLFGTWFIGGPILSIAEWGILQLLTLLSSIPYGLGVMVFSFIYSPLVLTGLHGPAIFAAILPIIMGTGPASNLVLAAPVASFAQLGACIGVGIVTRNFTLKKLAFSSIVTGVFGVTEPIIYGVTFPKGRPFIFGCISASVAGLICALLNIETTQLSAAGIFTILTVTGVRDQVLYVLNWTLALGLALGLTILFYSERADEKTLVQKTIKKLIYSIGLKKEKNELEELSNNTLSLFSKELEEIKNFKSEFKRMEKYISLSTKYKEEMINVEDKERKQRELMYKQLLALKEKMSKKPEDEMLKEKFLKLNKEYSEFNLEKEKKIIENNIYKNELENNELNNAINEQRNKFIIDSNKKLDLIAKEHNIDNIEMFKNNFWNALYSVEVGFGLENKKEAVFLKKYSLDTIKNIWKREKNETNTK